MKLPMQNLTSIFAANINNMDSGEVDSLNNVPMSAVINTDTAFLAFRSPWDRDYPNRPYLHILGSLQQLNGTLPYNISSIYTERNTTRVDAYYEFTNNQLSELVKKGLYERGFEVPEQIKESQLEVDVNCDLKIVKPDPDKNIDFPIVFAQVNNLRNLQLNQENSGYDLAEYFEQARVLDNSYQEANSYQIASDSETKESDAKLPKDAIIDFTDHSLENEIVSDEPVKQADNEYADANIASPDLSQATDSADKAESKVLDKSETANTDKQADNDLIKQARERIARRKAKIAQDAKAKAKKQKAAKKQNNVPDTESDNTEYRNNVRVNQVNNEQADLTKQGIAQKTIPETASDFENIDDEKLDKKPVKNKKHKKAKTSPIKTIDAPSIDPKTAQNDGMVF